jgi:hypothetical protein
MKLDELIKLYTALEDYFVDSINSHRREGEGRFVSVVEEHLFQIALDKLADKGKWKLRHELFYSIHDNFEIVDSGYERIYVHRETGEKTAVSPEDVIRYGNKYIWKDFLLTGNKNL